MQQSTSAMPARRPDPAPDLLGAPLPDLLAAYDVELFESSVSDAGFFGAFVKPQEGGRVLSMPSGRSEFERDTVARMLLAEAFGLDAPPLPSSLSVTRS